jgi:putative ABC transport system substrate-binding protein
MRRRDLLGALAAAAAAPSAARAQQKPMPVIGYLSTIVSFPALLDEFRRGLAEMGFVEGQNLRIEYRMAAGDYERLPALAAELVRVPVEVIVAAGGSPRAWLQRPQPTRSRSSSSAARTR